LQGPTDQEDPMTRIAQEIAQHHRVLLITLQFIQTI